MCGLEDLIELQVLHLELLGDCVDFLLEDEVVEALPLLDRVDSVVEYVEEGLALLLLVLVALHLDLVLVLEIPVALLLAVDLLLDLGLLLYYLVLLEQVLPVLVDLQLELLVRLHQLLALLLDLPQQPLVLVLLLVQLLYLVLQLLYQIQVGRSDLGVVGLDVRVLLRVLSRQPLDLVVLLVLQLLYQVLPIVLHLVTHFLHLQVVLLLQVVGPALELLPQLSLPLVILRLEREGVVLLAQLLLLEGYVERPDVGLESPLLDAMLILELLEGDLHIFSEFTLLVLVDEEDMLDSEWEEGYFCL